jgi:hypothetical protein
VCWAASFALREISTTMKGRRPRKDPLPPLTLQGMHALQLQCMSRLAGPCVSVKHVFIPTLNPLRSKGRAMLERADGFWTLLHSRGVAWWTERVI